MYQFKIRKQDDGVYRFELGGIKLLVDEFTVKEDRHVLANPTKAIAYFSIDNNIYGISNENFETAEAFYDAISKQYLIFTDGNAVAANA
ncbi:MAG: hypothetical protein V4649_14995 [Bacteroidota bacterium]